MKKNKKIIIQFYEVVLLLKFKIEIFIDPEVSVDHGLTVNGQERSLTAKVVKSVQE